MTIAQGCSAQWVALENAAQSVERAAEMLRDAGDDPEELQRRFVMLQQVEEDLDDAAVAYLECTKRGHQGTVAFRVG